MSASVRLVILMVAILALFLPWISVTSSSAAAVMVERPASHLAVKGARPGRLVVGLNPRSSLVANKQLSASALLRQRWGDELKVQSLFDGAALLVETQSDLVTLANKLRRDRDVRYVEPDYLYQATVAPNDEFYSRLYALPRISAPAAWDITTGSSGVTVAIVDTGVYAGHPDLRQNVVGGANFVDGGSNASDDEGHGTHTAGIVAAVGNNGRGIAGVCWQCKILPVKSLNHQGAGSAVDVSAGIRFAADRGAKVINLSLGGENDSRLLHDSIIYATSRGALVVVAAGNEALKGNPVEYPAAYSEVLAVGATDVNDAHAPFSNHGDYLDIAAPGVDIGSTIWFDGESEPYASASGTSEAAPFVSGVAALIWSINPGLSNQQVRQILLSTADDLGAPGRDAFFGVGRVNAYRAVRAAAPQPVATPTPAPPVPAPSPTSTAAPPVSAPLPTPTPVPADVLAFPETGHTLRGDFRRFWEANGGLAVFGYPIGEQQVEQTAEGSFIVQRFERNYFEYHPEKAASYQVLLGRLGDTVLQHNNIDWWSLPKGQPRTGCEFFNETGHSLCEPFLSYWRNHGLRDDNLSAAGRSLALFGMPLSEPRMETNAAGDTVMTQWFERARFEDHGSATGGPGVLLGLLGTELGVPPVGEPAPVVPSPPSLPDPQSPLPTPTAVATCPDVPASQSGVARPSACLPLGAEMVMDVFGFKGGEAISFWLTAPNGQVYGGQRTVMATAQGTLANQRYGTAGLLAGRWYWVFQGIESGHQSIVFYHLYLP